MTTCSLRARRKLVSQGFTHVADDAESAALARSARFQPRATLVLLAGGVALVASGLVGTTVGALWFAVLAALGWLAVAVPATNVFDLTWNPIRARGLCFSGAPPAPRRFSQAIAATFLTTIAILLALSATTAALVVAGVMAVAASLAAFADVCVGSEIYHLLFGRSSAV